MALGGITASVVDGKLEYDYTDKNAESKAKPVMRTDYVGIDSMAEYVTPYQIFKNAIQFESIDKAKLFFKENREFILKTSHVWGEPNNPRIVEVKSTDCLNLI